MNGGYIYGDSAILAGLINAIQSEKRTIEYKNAYYEFKKLIDSGKPIYFKFENYISAVLASLNRGNSYGMFVFLEQFLMLTVSPDAPNTITITIK